VNGVTHIQYSSHAEKHAETLRGKQETWLLIPIVLAAMMAVAASLEWPPSLWRLGAGWYPPHPLGAVHIAPQTHG